MGRRLPRRADRTVGFFTRFPWGFARHQLPQAHEFFAPMEALTAYDGDKNPDLHALIARASAGANFLTPP
jgi:hypothetical protein